MKRALAERARQAEALEKQLQQQQQREVSLTNVKDQQNHFDRGNHSIQVPSNTVTSNGGSVPTTPSTLSSGKPNDPKVLLRNQSDETFKNVQPQSPSSVDSQRPLKIPRLQAPPSSVPSSASTLVRESSTLTPQVSTSTNRRLSLDAQQAMNDNQDSSSSFYLKYQNRALATELKSYQFAVAELEQERDLRRSHCLSISQALYQINGLWNLMEQNIVSLGNDSSSVDDQATLFAPISAPLDGGVPSALKSHPEIPNGLSSTGTDDSVEWTRLLCNALRALGKPSVSPMQLSRTNDADNHHAASNASDDNTISETIFGSDYMSDLRSLDQTVHHISARARVLQEWICSIVRAPANDVNAVSAGSCVVPTSEGESSALSGESTRMQQQISEITAKCASLESQISELVSCRTSLIHRERRLRRNIYRMAANIITPEQVVNAITRDEADDNDDIEASVQIEKQRMMMMKKENQQFDSSTNSASGTSHGNDGNGASNSDNDAHVSTFQLEEYQSRITSLEDLLLNAERSIQELNSTLKEKDNAITFLSQKQLPDDVAIKLESLQSTLVQLQSSQAQNAELQLKLERTEQRWSQALGNEEAAICALSELVSKFNKRWLELSSFGKYQLHTEATNTATDNDEADSKMGNSASPLSAANGIIALDQDVLDHPFLLMSQQITELQHKLNQAMENVRQAELSRDNLKMALNMNTSLQAKLDEMKAKYAALQASRGSSGAKPTDTVPDATDTSIGVPTIANNSGSPGDDAVTSVVSDSTRTADVVADTESSLEPNLKASSSSKEKVKAPTFHKEKSGSGSKSNEAKSNSSHSKATSSSSSEKLHREYRRARKELAALTASHSTLMANNVRLLKQITEKDEMNAKSLSTILHLKSMTEKLIEERDTLELQLKSASQLALVARLATNAKERVSEELLKEKKEVDERLAELEKQLHVTQTELHRVSMDWSNASSRISSKETELSNAVQRSHSLAEENEQKREEIRKLVDIVSKAEREAREAKEKLIHFTKSSNDAARDSGGDSSFTIDQLKTQVSVLKNRLACPVCHYRDKECIILRCRHMHCKQCVEERVSNRSRKCPTCNVKFAENEVETIFLS